MVESLAFMIAVSAIIGVIYYVAFKERKHMVEEKEKTREEKAARQQKRPKAGRRP